MASLNICSKLFNTTERFQVTLKGVGFDTSTVENLAEEITKKIDFQRSVPVEFDMIYCGKVLMPSTFLSKYMLQSNSTVFVVKKFTSRTGNEKGASKNLEGAASTAVTKTEVIGAMHSALKCPDYREIAEKIVNDSEMLEDLVSSSPGLDEDPTVLTLLQQPDLIAVLLHKNGLDSLMQKHPSFGYAAVKIAMLVREEQAKRGTSSKTSDLTYSLDQMSDEEDDAPRANQRGGTQGASNITTSQLAAAIQAVTGTGSMGGATSFFGEASTSQEAPGPSSSSTITSDFFQQAMAHAQSTSSESALQQLREMGITDENVARQALAATGGDIEAAINLIFGDGMM